jgi:hypothetical protein
MTSRASRLLDLYTDYLLASFGQTTATGLADLVPDLSHDQVTRFLSRQELSDKDLWKAVKPLLRSVQSEDAVLILDDTIEEKPYTDESELISWHFDHVTNTTVKGINLLSALYLSQDVSLPVAFHLIHKTQRVTDRKTGKEKWQSPLTKNEIARDITHNELRVPAAVKQKQIPFRYVLADSWFSSAENMIYIKQKVRKDFVIPLKSNRNVFVSDPSAKVGKPVKLDSLDFDTSPSLVLYLEGVPFALQVSRQVFTNEDGKESVLYLSTSELTLTVSSLHTLYQKRWKVEEYHKSLKSNASFAKSPTKRIRTQTNHFIASILAFVKLEACRVTHKVNHFALKAKLYRTALASAFAELQQLRHLSRPECVR